MHCRAVDHLPLYRQHEIFARMGADIPESTLVGWVKIGPGEIKASCGRFEVMNAQSAGWSCHEDSVTADRTD